MTSPLKLSAVVIILSILTGCGTFSSVPLKSPSRSPAPPNTSNEQSALSREALRWLGRPYRFGGTNPASGFDCSGLVYYSALVTRGAVPPRTVIEQFAASKPVSMAELRSGDLVFYQINKKMPDHVGIYIGNSSFVHAPQTGGVVRIVDMRNSYWTKRFIGARRLN